MTERIRILLVSIVLLSFMGCGKDTDVAVEGHGGGADLFTAELTQYNDGVAKTHYVAEQDFICWTAEDAVVINGRRCVVNLPQEGSCDSATIAAKDVDTRDGRYYAAYPADRTTLCDDNVVKADIPTTDHYTTAIDKEGFGHQIISAPMAACSDSRHLVFDNLCALAQIGLRCEGSGSATLHQVALECDQPIAGTLTAAHDRGRWSTDGGGLDSHRRVLVCDGDDFRINKERRTAMLYTAPVNNGAVVTLTITIAVDNIDHTFRRELSGPFNWGQGTCQIIQDLVFDAAALRLTDAAGNTYAEIIPTGSDTDPYIIKNEAELHYWMAQYGNSDGTYFKLAGDFAIQHPVPSFCGILDGDGHHITLTNSALFTSLDNGSQVKNLILEGKSNSSQVFDNANHRYGTLAVQTTGATIENIVSYVEIDIAYDAYPYYMGGIVGQATSSTLSRCHYKGRLTAHTPGKTAYIGGVAGSVNGTTRVINSSNTATLSASGSAGSQLGGLVGSMASTAIVENSYCHASLEDNGDEKNLCIGGVVGKTGSKNTLQNCYYYGTISGNGQKSGVCHTNSGTIRRCYYPTQLCALFNETGSTADCLPMSSATTINDNGTSAELYAKLNNNIATLGITDADHWTTVDGIVTFEDE